MRKTLLAMLIIVLAGLGCSKVKNVGSLYNRVVAKDIALEDQKMLIEKYVNNYAWTRSAIEDITEREIPGEPKKKVVLRDSKILIVDLNFAYNGAVTIEDKKKRRIVHALEIEEPLSVEKIEARLGQFLWFDSPLLRHVAYIRKWGKKAARAVVNHDVFIGMPSDAALESWGLPTQVLTNEISTPTGGTQIEEQWTYRQTSPPRYIYITDGILIKWEDN